MRENLFADRRFGFTLTDEGEFQLTLSRASGGKLILSCDRASWPAFALDIEPRDSDRRYAVWLLMKIMEPHATPSWPEQLALLDRRLEGLIASDEVYSASYRELDTPA